ncbi:hypothetical protein E3T37_00715 [Cryobacterium sp. TMT2-10]|uniref:hypothetical protein n=1 Tax=Cryobacterium sp. TMT2-10 TaxID=1259244 RepID=UPI00106C9115|nr:hypothetical protein [Cryobacterium sp. TMT2-10]TFD43757.1 hypothetical protein E3T37_00715 [Cryobacterium sp. TMT2-10]
MPRAPGWTSSGQLLQIPSTLSEYVGSKLLTITPENARAGRPVIQGLYLLFGGGDQRPLAVLDSMALTNVRTAAVSGMGARRLAAPGRSASSFSAPKSRRGSTSEPSPGSST